MNGQVSNLVAGVYASMIIAMLAFFLVIVLVALILQVKYTYEIEIKSADRWTKTDMQHWVGELKNQNEKLRVPIVERAK